MRRGLWLFLTLAAGLSGRPGIPAGLALADDANRSKAGNRRQPAPGGIERSDPRLASLMLRKGNAPKLSSSWSNLFRRTRGHKSLDARLDKNPNLLERLFRPARGIRLPGDATNSLTGPTAPRSMASSPYRAFPKALPSLEPACVPKITLYAIVLLGRYRTEKQKPQKNISVKKNISAT